VTNLVLRGSFGIVANQERGACEGEAGRPESYFHPDPSGFLHNAL
jgi:hypothetical protein